MEPHWLKAFMRNKIALPSGADAVIRLELHRHDVSLRLEDRRRHRLVAAVPAELVGPVEGFALEGGHVVEQAAGLDL